MFKRIISGSLALVTMMIGIPFACFANTGTTTHYSHNFESAPTTSTWTSDPSGFNISYVTGKWKIISGAETPAISGKTPLIHTADMRWWSVSYKNDVMTFAFDFRVDENFNGTLHFAVTSQDPATTTEGLTGTALLITKEGNAVVMKNHKGSKVATVERGKVNHVELVFKTGSKNYQIKLNNESLGENHVFYGALVTVCGMRFQISSAGENNYIALDNFTATSTGWSSPRPYSWQEIGKIPDVTIPEAPEERLYAYFNKNEIDLHELAAVEADDTVYLPMEKVFAAAGLTYLVGAVGQIEITVGDTTVVLCEGERVVRIADKYIELKHAPKMENGVLYLPLQFFVEALDAKAWYDQPSKTVLLTTGDYKTDNILRLYNGKFFKNGEIYYEISFNKFDLQSQIWADPAISGASGYTDRVFNNAASCLEGAEKALKTLSENGFKTIRVFCNGINLNRKPSEVDAFFRATDKMYDLCDKYGIQVVACLGLISEEFLDAEYVDGIFSAKSENLYHYFTDAASISRKNAYAYLEKYINRYKDRDTILMWEITNEGNLGADVGEAIGSATYSLLQLAQFYNDFGTLIHQLDPERLVTSGDSMLRSAQWNLFTGSITGKGINWTVDTALQRKKALALLYEVLDVISIHGYDVGYETGNGHGLFVDLEGNREKTHRMQYEDYLAEARLLNKGFYNGETGGQMLRSGDHLSASAAEGRKEYLQTIVDAGVQLSHWWSFQSNRNGAGFNNDLNSWSVTIENTPETFAAIKQANETLRAKWIVNAAESANTSLVKSESFVTYKGSMLSASTDKTGGCGANVATIPTLLAFGALPFIKRKKDEE